MKLFRLQMSPEMPNCKRRYRTCKRSMHTYRPIKILAVATIFPCAANLQNKEPTYIGIKGMIILVRALVIISRTSRNTLKSFPAVPIFRLAMPIPKIKASMRPVITSNTGVTLMVRKGSYGLTSATEPEKG